jgi:enoyl-CoA hydratase
VLPLPLLRELLLEARLMEAPEALARGVVSRVVPDDEIAHEATRSAQRMARLSPQAARLNKMTLRQLAEGGPTPAQRHAHYAYADSAEHREGLAAFLEKRPARFAP